MTNTGDTYSGKDAVEIYVQSPYTAYDVKNGVEKASVSLCGFAKTKELAPGETQTVEILVDRRDIASYDAYGAKTYILDDGTCYFTAADDAHGAVNNILAAKGYTPENTNGVMDAAGNAAMTFTYINPVFDDTTYATSSVTGAQITNQFSDVDLNLYDNGAQSVTYLSRNDWQGTFPKAISDLALTDAMAADVADRRYTRDENSTVEMPVTGADNGKKLIEYKGVDFDDPSWDQLLDQMTYEEMASLVGHAFHLTMPVISVDMPGTWDENGPQGLTARLMLGNVDSTSLTSEDVMAATWNVDLLTKVGECIGEDCLANGYAGLYGPGNNIHRTPYGGRNFEYYSEDGFLSGKLSEKEISAIQSNGIYVFMKHAVLNEGETERSGLCTWANEQAIREVYLKAFQYPMEANDTAGVMTAMPRLGCVWAGAHEGLLTGVFRNEWGSKGMFISDNTTTHVFMDGLDAVVAGGTLFDAMMGVQYRAYMEDGEDDPVIVSALREASHYNLYAIANSSAMNGITAEDEIVASYPAWRIGLWILTAVFIALFVWQLVMAILRSVRFRRDHKKPVK